jgi:hypothetical protein
MPLRFHVVILILNPAVKKMDRVSWWQKGFWRMNQQSVHDSAQIVGEIQNFRRFVVSGGKTSWVGGGFITLKTL